MFRTLFRAELNYWLRKPLPYAFAFVLFAISFATLWGTAAEATGGEGAELINSPYRLAFMSNFMGQLLYFLLPSIVGAGLYRDYKSRMHTLLYAYPISKRAYLGAKLTAGLFVSFLVVCAIGAGFALGATMPGIDPTVIEPFQAGPYVALYAIFLLPNVLLFGLFVFALVVRTRNIYIAFIGIIILLAAQGMASGLVQTADFKPLAALLDPSGDTALRYMMSGRSFAERNEAGIPFHGLLLANRLAWFGVSLSLLMYIYRSFSFSQFVAQKRKALKAQRQQPVHRSGSVFRPTIALQPAKTMQVVWSLSTHHFRAIVFSWPFVVLLLVGLLSVYYQQSNMNPEFGFAVLPTTDRMLRVPMLIFGLTINLVTFLYVGVLAHQGRTTRMADLVDATATPTEGLLFAQLLAVWRVQLVLLSLVLVGGVLTQLIQGYTRIELWHYALELYGLHFVHYAIWACLAFAVHAWVRNLYIGLFILILVSAGFSALAEVGNLLALPILADSVVQFNTTPGSTGGFSYSDFYGYDGALSHYFAYKLYWGLGASLLGLLAFLGWRRGYTYTLQERIQVARNRLQAGLRPVFFALVVAFLGIGAALYQHDHNWVGRAPTQATFDTALLRNEQVFADYLNAPQPRLTRVSVEMKLFPQQRRYEAVGVLTFVNKLDRAIDTIVVHTSFRDSVTFEILQPHRLIVHDAQVHTTAMVLTKALGPGDSMHLQFEAQNTEHAVLLANDRVRVNGTYLIGAQLLPAVGVRDAFLQNEEMRLSFGLSAKPPVAHSSSALDYRNPANKMGRIAYSSTVSTDEGQEALTIGTLDTTWIADGRRVATYRSDGGIVPGISWMSGRYSRRVDTTAILPVVYYVHPDHEDGLVEFSAGVRAGLALNTELFGPLTHDTLKVVEFPKGVGTHATLNGNLIPTSEGYFLCDIDPSDAGSFNVPFFVGAHEVTHYWWGHRVDPANVPGGRAITEGLCDYLAMEAVKRSFGDAHANFLRETWQTFYYRAASNQANKISLLDAPLDDEHDYLNYRLAALRYHELAEAYGQEFLYTALASFELEHRWRGPPFTTMHDLVEHLACAAGEEGYDRVWQLMAEEG